MPLFACVIPPLETGVFKPDLPDLLGQGRIGDKAALPDCLGFAVFVDDQPNKWNGQKKVVLCLGSPRKTLETFWRGYNTHANNVANFKFKVFAKMISLSAAPPVQFWAGFIEAAGSSNMDEDIFRDVLHTGEPVAIEFVETLDLT